MKRYGSKVATEFTKKQINVIYAKAKNGNLKIEHWAIEAFYDASDYYGYDDNRSMEEEEREILKVLDAVFNDDMDEAQKLINAYTEKHWALMGRKEQAKRSREYL